MSWSKEEFLNDVAVIDGDTATFNMQVDFHNLVDSTDGVSFLNNLVDEFVDNGYLLEDMSYRPVACSGDDILIEVVADARGFLK